MLFDELGIYGWDVVEPLVLAAIVADLPVLLIGDIGTNKTEGSKTIAQAVLGAGKRVSPLRSPDPQLRRPGGVPQPERTGERDPRVRPHPPVHLEGRSRPLR